MNKREWNTRRREMLKELSPALQAAARAYSHAKRQHRDINNAARAAFDQRTADMRREQGRHG